MDAGLVFMAPISASHCCRLVVGLFAGCLLTSDAVCLSGLQVVRCFEDDDIVHVSGKVSLSAAQQAAGLARALSQHRLCCLKAIMLRTSASFEQQQPSCEAQPVLEVAKRPA